MKRTPQVGTCMALGCSRAKRARGYCMGHYQRMRLGIPLEGAIRTPQGPRGSGYIDVNGYRRLPGKANGQRSVLEHRQVMETVLGRPLLPDETVHHKNGDRTDNRPENLELWVGQHSRGQRVEDRVEDAIAVLARYAPERLTDLPPKK